MIETQQTNESEAPTRSVGVERLVILRCPFCGSDDTSEIKTGADTYFYACKNCNVTGPSAYDKAIDALYVWNGRAR